MAVWSACNQSDILTTGRMDAEYYRPKFLANERILNQLNAVPLRNYLEFVRCGPFGSTITCDTYLEEGTVVARPFNIDDMFFRYENLAFISIDDVRKKGLKLYSGGDVFFSRVGDIRVGYLAANSKHPTVTISPNIIVARLKPNSLKSEYLTVFLNTRYGQEQIERALKVVAQPTISTSLVSKLKVFRPHDDVEQKVSELLLRSLDTHEKAKELYTQAQQLIESELGLDKLRFDKPVGYTARFSVVGLSDSVSANRIDAQCFSPEAVFYEDWLLKHANCDRLSLLLASTAKGRQQAEAETGTTNYCSIKHITGHEIVGASKAYPAAGTPTARKHDLLLAITGATIGKIGIVNRYDNLVFSGDMLRLRANGSINPHYLLLALDHHLGQVQFNRWITGSTNGHLAPRDVGRVLVPRLAPKKEEQIAALVAESLEKRQESEQLLDQAKSRVEQLIEEAVRR